MRGKRLGFAACILLSGCTVLAPDGLDPYPKSDRADVRIARSDLGHRAVTGAEPTPLRGYDPRVYELLIRLDGAQARVVGFVAQPDWALDVAPMKKGKGKVPAVAEQMLSMADAAWSTSTTTGRHKSLFKETQEERRVEAIRLLAYFSPKSGVQCAAQQKLFADSLSRRPSPADTTVDEVWADLGIDADDLPRIELPKSGGQLLLRLREEEPGRYVQELHVAYDYDAPKEGELYEVAMTCRGPLSAITKARPKDGPVAIAP